LISSQQAAYVVEGVDENVSGDPLILRWVADASQVPAAPVLKREHKKRKVLDYTSATPSGEGTSNKHRKTENSERKSKNTAVYVTGLPSDTEQDEMIERFSKCGVIEEDEHGEPKVKLYAKEDGSFSGDALVVFFKEDSVTLAVNLLDEAELRLGQPHTVMKVSKADFKHKNHSTGGGGESQPRKTVDKKRITKRIGKMQKFAYAFYAL
jgi:HIV Tat-specific factor 1